MKSIKKIFLVLLLISVLPLKTNAITQQQKKEIDAVLETSLAYKNKGKKIQYDSYRKSYFSAPEDATSQRTIYTVCSGFTYQVYYHALGVKIPEYTENLIEYAEKYKSNKDNVIIYYEREKDDNGNYISSYLDGDKRVTFEKAEENFLALAQPGDILVAQDTGTKVSGHAMLVVKTEDGIITVRHSTGNRFDPNTFIETGEGFGMIDTNPFPPLPTDPEEKEKYNYIKKSSKIALIRVVTEDSKYIDDKGNINTYSGITPSAQTRLDYPGIDIEKTAVVTSSDGVETYDRTARPGDSITYTILIQNKGNSSYSSFKVEENVSGVTVTNRGNGTLNNNKLSWTVQSLTAGSSTTLTYTVQIPNDESLLGTTIVSTGNLENIAMTKVETVVENKLTKAEKEKVVKAFNALTSTSSTSKSTEKDFIDEIYMDALGLDLALGNWDLFDIISSAEGIQNSDTSKVFVKHTKVNNTKYKYAIHNNLYGLRINKIIVGDGNWNYHTTELYKDRVRLLLKELFDTGDVLLLHTGKTLRTDKELVDKAYIYIDGYLYRKTSTGLEIIDDVDDDGKNGMADQTLFEFLRSTVFDNYVVLRPSLLIGVDFEEDTEEEKPIIPDKDDKDDKDDGEVEEEIENPVTGVIAKSGILVILLFTCAAIYLFLRKKSNFPKHS